MRSKLLFLILLFAYFLLFIFSPTPFHIEDEESHYKISFFYTPHPIEEIEKILIIPIENRLIKFNSLSQLDSSITQQETNIFFTLSGKEQIQQNDFANIRRYLLDFSQSFPDSFSKPIFSKDYNKDSPHFVFVTATNHDWIYQFKSLAQADISGEKIPTFQLTLQSSPNQSSKHLYDETHQIVTSLSVNQFISSLSNSDFSFPIYLTSSPFSESSPERVTIHPLQAFFGNAIQTSFLEESQNSEIFINHQPAKMITLKLKSISELKKDIKNIRKELKKSQSILIYDKEAEEKLLYIKKALIFLSYTLITLLIFLLIAYWTHQSFHLRWIPFIFTLFLWSPLFFDTLSLNSILIFPIIITLFIFYSAPQFQHSLFFILLSIILFLISILFFTHTNQSIHLLLLLILPLLIPSFTSFNQTYSISKIHLSIVIIALMLIISIFLPLYFSLKNSHSFKMNTLFFPNGTSLETTRNNTLALYPFLEKELLSKPGDSFILEMTPSKTNLYHPPLSPSKQNLLIQKLSNHPSIHCFSQTYQQKQKELIITHPNKEHLDVIPQILQHYQNLNPNDRFLISSSSCHSFQLTSLKSPYPSSINSSSAEDILFNHLNGSVENLIYNQKRTQIKLNILSYKQLNASSQLTVKPTLLKEQLLHHQLLPAVALTYIGKNKCIQEDLSKLLQSYDSRFQIKQQGTPPLKIDADDFKIFALLYYLIINFYLYLPLKRIKTCILRK